jgi:competence protein ComEC
MRLLNFTIIKLAFFLIVGILVGYFFEVSTSLSIILSISLLTLLLVLLLIARKQFIKTIWFGAMAFLTMMGIGVLTVTLHNEKNLPTHYTRQISTENDSLKTITFRIREVLKPNDYYDKYVIDILEVDKKQTTGKSLLNIQKDSTQTAPQVDAIFISKTEFKIINTPLNPKQFDYKNYLNKKYIYHQLTINHKSLFKIDAKNPTLFGIANTVRSFINSKLTTYSFKPDELAIINALLLGQRQDISEDIYSSYTNAGVIHILAVSGLHVGIILLMLNFLFRPVERLKNGYILKTIIVVSILWSFAIIAGLSASVTRAVTMFSIVAIAMNLKRPTNIYNTLAISILVILVFKPLFLFDVGFQLSYIAVFSIVTIHPHLNRLWKPKNRLANLYWQTLIVTIAAQIGIIPISLYYFHQFPSLFFVSNLVIIPLLGIILGFGIVVIILASLSMLPNLVAIMYGYIISSMNGFVGWISQQEAFLFKDIPFNFLYLLASYALIIALVQLLLKRNHQTLRAFLLTILTFQGAMIYTHYSKPSHEFVVFHKSRYSLLGNTLRHSIVIAHDLDSAASSKNNIVRDYCVGNYVDTIKEDSLQPVYLLKDKKLLVIDSLGIYNIKSFEPDYVLLRQSPKINLNRLIDSIKPKQVIVDGSNYTSYVENWKTVCGKRKIPFHATREMGAFIIDY